jgi:hemolysin III
MMNQQPNDGELVNTLTHGIGALLSIAAGLILLPQAAATGDVWRIAGCTVFVTALVGVYIASTLSHAVRHPEFRHWFRMLDQGFIYLLIVATYTPFSLAFLRDGWWWAFLAVMWSIAAFGFISKVIFAHRVNATGVWSYLILGWMTLVPALGHNGAVPFGAIQWIFAGGVCYTLGTIFLMVDHKPFHFHAIWHLLVIGGSTCHFLGVLWFVAH